MKIAKTIVSICFLAAPLVHASESCDLLTEGNRYYSKGRYNHALDVYTQVEEFDRRGREDCTKSIYATIATIYTIFGDKSVDRGDYREAAENYKTASKYNRAYASAVECNLAGSCK